MIDPFAPLYDRFGATACSLALADLGYETQPSGEPERSEAAAIVLAYLDAPPYVDPDEVT
jgi:hypothetical protein